MHAHTHTHTWEGDRRTDRHTHTGRERAHGMPMCTCTPTHPCACANTPTYTHVQLWLATFRNIQMLSNLELCDSWGGHPRFPIPNSLDPLCGHKAASYSNYTTSSDLISRPWQHVCFWSAGILNSWKIAQVPNCRIQRGKVFRHLIHELAVGVQHSLLQVLKSR